MSALIVPLFLTFILAVEFFSAANDLRLRAEYPPLIDPENDDDLDDDLLLLEP